MKISLVVVLLVSIIAVVKAACPWETAGATKWSSTWSTAPAAGATINITSGQKVVYDLTTAVRYTGIFVNTGGSLIFDNVNVALETGFIVVEAGASFIVGSSECPFTKKSTVTYYGDRNGYNAMDDFGYKGLISRGTVSIISGSTRYPTWTRLSSTLQVSGTTISVDDSVTWIPGDVIVIASTDYNGALSERFTVVSVSGKTITLNRPATYMHWGQGYEKAEVGLLTRDVLFQGDDSSDKSTFGGQTFIRAGFVQIQGAEFNRMGQAGVLGRYPVHYHFLADQTGNNVFLKDSSIHDTYQRCFTIHAAQGIVVDNNVAFNSTGHCYFLEDGIETGNVFNHNLGIYTRPGKLLPSDTQPTIFWIVNPNNTYTNNAACGGQFGFWFAMPIHPTGKSTAAGVNVWPRYTPLLKFDNNVAHSADDNCVHIDDGANTDDTTSMSSYTPMQGPFTSSTAVWNTPQVTAEFTRQLAYKCRGYGWWARGAALSVGYSVFVDNLAGVNQPADSNIVHDSIFIGQTDNYGTLKQVSWAQEDGRARPVVWNKAAVIRGFESYDSTGPQFSLRNTFYNFTNDSTRRAGAYGALPNGKFIIPWTNMARQSTLNGQNEWAMEPNSVSADGPAYFVMQDVDGSLTGAYGNFITANVSLVRDDTCVQKPNWGDTWPFFLCPRTENGYSFITVNNPDVGSTDFGTSTSQHFRANWYKLGSNVPSPITGGDISDTTRDSYTANVPSRNAYALRFPHPTPPTLSLGIMHAFTGEWVVLALSYPSSTTFTITRGYANTPMTAGSSRADVGATTYYFDSNGQTLYVMYYEDNGGTQNPRGFPENGYIGNAVKIVASCGRTCTASNTAIPSAWVDTDDKYRAVANGCGAGTTSPYEATAYFQYNPKTHVLSYLVYHNHPAATSIQIVNAAGKVVHTAPVPQAPVKSAFVLSATWFQDLYAGKWTVVITSAAFPAGDISGVIGCSSGSCSAPPGTSTTDPCATISGESIVYDDALGSIGWQDWSYSVTRDLAFAVNPKCGTKSAQITYQGGALSLNQGGCYPGQCDASKSWIKPYLSVGSLAFLQFVVKTMNGTAQLSVSVNTPDGGAKTLEPVPFNYIDNYSVQDGWTRVKIPVGDLGLTSSSYVGRLTITLYQQWQSYNKGIVIFLDQIKFVPAYSDPTSQPTTTAAAAFSVKSCNNPTVAPSSNTGSQITTSGQPTVTAGTSAGPTTTPSSSGGSATGDIVPTVAPTLPAPSPTMPISASTPAATPTRAAGIYTLVKQSSTWKYASADPGDLAFTSAVPSSWPLGYAPFGFGSGTAFGTKLNVTGGAYYFSRAFRVTGDPTTITGARLRISANRDIQFYINGKALRQYPSGTKTAAYWNAALNPDTSNWVTGWNVIAAVMQPKSTDIAFFDAKLTIGESDVSALTSEDLASSSSTLVVSMVVAVMATVLCLVF